VPQRAVTELQGTYQVAVVGADSVVHTRSVKTGERTGTRWIVDAGLQAGERIVVEGVQKIRDGTTVKALPFSTSPATNSATTPAR
ncbi:MAG: efflux transporter periplasmic adaptor subunit, partial [Kiritimatiellaeota bacterium]|nr:efflux transporter periplasmic adaptor subunit [Kiritimatiellota bacterium]